MKNLKVILAIVFTISLTSCRKWIPRPFKKIKTFTISGTLFLRCGGPVMANTKMELVPSPYHKSKETFYCTTDANGNFTFVCTDEKAYFTERYYINDPYRAIIENLLPKDTVLNVYSNLPEVKVIYKLDSNSIYNSNDTLYWAQTMLDNILEFNLMEYVLLDTLNENKIIKIQNGGVSPDNFYKGYINVVWGKGYIQYLLNAKEMQSRLENSEYNLNTSNYKRFIWQNCGDKVLEMKLN